MSINWPVTRLGEVIREDREPVGTFDGDSLPVFGVTNIKGVTQTGVKVSEDRSKYLRLRPDRFVYNPYRVNVGSLGVSSSTQNGIVSPAYVVFAPTEKIDHKFLYYFLKSPKGSQLINFYGNRGSVRSALRFDDLCQIEIPLPTLSGQQRIVERIGELTAQIQEASILREQAMREVSYLWTNLIESQFSKFIGEKVPIGNVFRVTTGGTPKRSNSAYWSGDIKWVSSGEVAFCRIHDTKEKITMLGVDNSSAKIHPSATVLLAMIGQGKTRGQCAILDCYAATNQNVAAIHVYETLHSPEYVYWWLLASYQKSRTSETGTAQPALSGERVKRMLIPLPAIADQHRIVAELGAFQSEVDMLKRLQVETAAELDALMSSILDKAFKGEL